MARYVYAIRELENNRNYNRTFDGKGNESFTIFDDFTNAMAHACEWEETFGNELTVEPVCLNLRYVLYDKEDNKTKTMNMLQILEEINRDASDEWEDFDQTDFVGGLEDFTDLELKAVYLVSDEEICNNIEK